MNDKFRRFLEERYPTVRLSFPGEGRRKWRLRVIEALWLVPELQAEIASAALSSQGSPQEADYENDEDPLDPLTDGTEVGLLIRTDFANDVAWNNFLQQLQATEKEFIGSLAQADNGDAQGNDDVEMEEGAAEPASGSESETTPEHIIKVIASASDPLFQDISNLTALRLLNDVGLRPAPLPSTGINRMKIGNRLIDRNGLQEIYTGKSIWIYDEQSNTDGSARLVSQQGDVYGTATGDSWRARAAHVAELQFNMSCYNMRIDFGGLDRWDQSERERNLNEAEGH